MNFFHLLLGHALNLANQHQDQLSGNVSPQLHQQLQGQLQDTGVLANWSPFQHLFNLLGQNQQFQNSSHQAPMMHSPAPIQPMAYPPAQPKPLMYRQPQPNNPFSSTR